jgi:hypothetical protein
MAAADMLIEAKALLKLEWLPWLRDHCAISERTAQLYMRCAKNRAEIEKANAQSVADLSLKEAAAILMLSSDIRKLFEMTKSMEGLQGEHLIITPALSPNAFREIRSTRSGRHVPTSGGRHVPTTRWCKR